jgi:hypothetical protein
MGAVPAISVDGKAIRHDMDLCRKINAEVL